ncbi:MAG TPA: hypothetical protein VGH14_18135 [Solirubrobacterales bacterium]|jgi:hypothetical protein
MVFDRHSSERRATIAVRPGRALRERLRLFGVLETAFPVSFVPLDGEVSTAAAPTIVFAGRGDHPSPTELARGGEPSLVVGAEDAGGAAHTVKLGNDRAVDARLHGVELPDRPGAHAIAPDGHTTLLATACDGPVWLRCATGGTTVDLLAGALPELAADEILRDLLPERGLTLVALVQFLRAASAEAAYAPPPLRAAFLFDDPNLRWRTYGFIDYGRLLRDAEAHGYHASMAMVPLDNRFAHAETIDLFRRNPDRLSLVFHGNDHSSRELLRPRSEASALALAAQALRRAERFESRYALGIDRVMTPPHGMCSEEVAAALAAVGFDGLCAIHPLPWAERPPADRPLAGWDPAEFAAGCAVVPRLHLHSTDADIALRAFLDQPLVFYGHHEDLAAGLDPLGRIAERVARMGTAHWCSIGEIAATNYAARRDLDLLRVHPYANRIAVSVPAGCDRVLLARPRGVEATVSGWSIGAGEAAPFDTPLPVTPSGKLELRVRRDDERPPTAIKTPPTRPWAILRKVAMEARDRTLPLRA